MKFVDISYKIEYFYHLQIGNLHYQTPILFFYDKHKLNIANFHEFWQFSLVPTQDFWSFLKNIQNVSKCPRICPKHLDITVLECFKVFLGHFS
jgi:hypothetical protein